MEMLMLIKIMLQMCFFIIGIIAIIYNIYCIIIDFNYLDCILQEAKKEERTKPWYIFQREEIKVDCFVAFVGILFIFAFC